MRLYFSYLATDCISAAPLLASRRLGSFEFPDWIRSSQPVIRVLELDDVVAVTCSSGKEGEHWHRAGWIGGTPTLTRPTC